MVSVHKSKPSSSHFSNTILQEDLAVGVDSGILTFVNHGCNGTYNMGRPYNETEVTIPLGQGPPDIFGDAEANDVFHPFNERHFECFECPKEMALRAIEAGEELLDNYVSSTNCCVT
mgnify:FL=1